MFSIYVTNTFVLNLYKIFFSLKIFIMTLNELKIKTSIYKLTAFIEKEVNEARNKKGALRNTINLTLTNGAVGKKGKELPLRALILNTAISAVQGYEAKKAIHHPTHFPLSPDTLQQMAV